VDKLSEKRNDPASVRAGVVESETLTFRVPEEPLTRDGMNLSLK